MSGRGYLIPDDWENVYQSRYNDNQLEIIVENEDGSYKKHFVGLSDNVTYVVEDLDVNHIEKYKYTLNYNPKMWIPFEVETID